MEVSALRHLAAGWGWSGPLRQGETGEDLEAPRGELLARRVDGELGLLPPVCVETGELDDGVCTP
jgi:hypothetical protein